VIGTPAGPRNTFMIFIGKLSIKMCESSERKFYIGGKFYILNAWKALYLGFVY
jgi:hypothetical protein